MTSLTIGELGARADVAPHVLRHWEDVGLLHPERTPSGHRRYPEATTATVRTIRRLQRAGLSLEGIAALGRGAADRRALVARHVARLTEDRATLDAAIAFLTHTLTCRHPVADECPGCAAFAGTPT